MPRDMKMPMDQENAPMMQETDQNSPPSPSQEGYQIIFSVLPDGFRISEPEPLAPAPQSPDLAEQEDTLPDLTTALKHLLAIVKEHPIGENSQEQFQAGYGAR